MTKNIIDLHQGNTMFEASTRPGKPGEAQASIAITPAAAATLSPQTIKIACSNCNLRELCMPLGLSPTELDRIDEVVASRRKIKRGETLFRSGERFTSLYAIRTGFFKTRVAAEDGRDQVTGFQMAGEVIGLDGIVSERHSCDAVALEDAEENARCYLRHDRIQAT